MKLDAQHLSYAYTPGSPVLRDVSLTLESGEIMFVMGRNGSGKTTLLTCLSGIRRPGDGRVLLDGTDIHRLSPSERARHIGLIPQLHTPAFAYTVREMVLMGRAPHLGIFGSPSRLDGEVSDTALESVGLTGLRHRPYTELSGGEQRLVMIARGLAQQSPILLMDEPDAHLDPNKQHQVLEIVAQLAQRGLSFIISSHSPNNALLYADRVLLLNQGRILAQGRAADTLTEPLLAETYGMEAEVIYEDNHNARIPRAVLPRRPVTLSPAKLHQADSLLAQIFAQSRRKPQLILLTGLSGNGKTTWCAELVEAARQHGWSVGGLLSPAVFEGQQKIGIDLLDLASGERRRLAQRCDDTSQGLLTTRWHFDPAVMDWGNRLLRGTTPFDLLVIDELGPLELLRNEGLVEAMRLLDERRYKVACVVVRLSLLSEARQNWSDAHVISPPGENG